LRLPTEPRATRRDPEAAPHPRRPAPCPPCVLHQLEHRNDSGSSLPCRPWAEG
jgi:hypothetical protein